MCKIIEWYPFKCFWETGFHDFYLGKFRTGEAKEQNNVPLAAANKVLFKHM